ncbi:hypothetical protein HRD78_12390 [Enterococcus faecalis]|nr:hypothetical protein [Enterococcus faecalis]
MDKYTRYMMLLLLFFLMLGFMSTLLYRIQQQKITIIKDIVLFTKFFICYAGGQFLFYELDLNPALKIIQKINKVSIVIIFCFSLLSLVTNIGMGSMVRYGIRSYQFLFPHYTYLVYAVVIILVCLTMESKKNYMYKSMALVILLLTLRSKAFIFVGFYLLIMIFWKYLKEIKLSYIVVSLGVTAILVQGKVAEYLSWGIYNLRTGLYIVTVKIANDYFPLGTGFGSYGTNLSKENFSPVYVKYELIYSQGFRRGTGDFPISDVFWPSILGQWGYFGSICYVLMLVLVYCSMRYQTRCLDQNVYLAGLFLFIYLIIASSAEAIFTNETGVYIAVILSMYFRKKDKEDGIL